MDCWAERGRTKSSMPWPSAPRDCHSLRRWKRCANFFSFLLNRFPGCSNISPGSRRENFRAGFDLQVDQLTVVMLLVVTGVGWLIHIYSTGYMAHEGGYYRFFSYLNLFMFFMLILVLAANYVLLFVGWEGVGLCELPADRILFPEEIGGGCGQKSVHRKSHRRFRFHAGNVFVVPHVRNAGFRCAIFAKRRRCPRTPWDISER